MIDRFRLEEIVREAGRIAHSRWPGAGHALHSWDKTPGNPVSEADLEVDRFLKRELGRLLPSAAWLSEETADDKARNRMRFLARQISDAMAPSNYAATNPEFIKLAVETKGQSITDGINNLLEVISSQPESQWLTHRHSVVEDLSDLDGTDRQVDSHGASLHRFLPIRLLGLDAGQHFQVFDSWPPVTPLSRYSCLRQLGHATLGFTSSGRTREALPRS